MPSYFYRARDLSGRSHEGIEVAASEEEVLRVLEGSKLVPVVLSEAPNEIQSQYLDASKARKLLGWRPLYGFDEGLRRTSSWYREHLKPSP